MHKEKIKFVDGEVKDVEVMILGFRKVKQLKSKYFKVTKVDLAGKDVKSMEGDFDHEGLSMEATMTAVKGLAESDWDKVDPDDADRIYNTYLDKYFSLSKDHGEAEKK